MSMLTLPALRSDDPLGFLAALGVLTVLRSETEVVDDELALGWERVGGPAVVQVPFDTLDELVDALHEAANRLLGEGRVFAAGPAELPPERLSKEERAKRKEEASEKVPLDPLRAISRADAIKWYRDLVQTRDPQALRWLCGFLDQISTLSDSHFAAVTPLIVLSRQQTSRQVCRGLLETVAANRRLIDQALRGWQRVAEQAGANLDWRAVRSAALRTDGTSQPAAVPGLEWLALQSAPWFRLSGEVERPMAWCWLPRGESRGNLRMLFWPVWQKFLDPYALEVLLSHPAIRNAVKHAHNDGQLRRLGSQLEQLGVLAVLKSTRRREANADGPLGPAEIAWPARQ